MGMAEAQKLKLGPKALTWYRCPVQNFGKSVNNCNYYASHLSSSILGV